MMREIGHEPWQGAGDGPVDGGEIRQWAGEIVTRISRTLFGLDDITQLLVVALLSEGHVLLEGNPGLGKTELVKALTRALDMSVESCFRRIQFTPDLMPFDITGTRLPDLEGSGNERLVRGPIFGSLILADEINRASPKTQSAMLEAMAERQVTILGERHPLPSPFMVLATQNPIDHEGTYDLPEAQLDRFLFKIVMRPVGAQTLHRILDKALDQVVDPGESRASRPLDEVREDLALYRRFIRGHAPVASLRTHIVNLVLASNRQFGELAGLDRRQIQELEKLVADLAFGLGPRAAQALLYGAQTWSMLFFGEPHDAGQGLGRVAPAVLRHRLRFGRDGWEPETDAEARLRDFVLATAPAAHGYRDAVAEGLEGAP